MPKPITPRPDSSRIRRCFRCGVVCGSPRGIKVEQPSWCVRWSGWPSITLKEFPHETGWYGRSSRLRPHLTPVGIGQTDFGNTCRRVQHPQLDQASIDDFEQRCHTPSGRGLKSLTCSPQRPSQLFSSFPGYRQIMPYLIARTPSPFTTRPSPIIPMAVSADKSPPYSLGYKRAIQAAAAPPPSRPYDCPSCGVVGAVFNQLCYREDIAGQWRQIVSSRPPLITATLKRWRYSVQNAGRLSLSSNLGSLTSRPWRMPSFFDKVKLPPGLTAKSGCKWSVERRWEFGHPNRSSSYL